MSKYVIFAPHVDDEMIGCFNLINEGKIDAVYYFYDLTEDRIQEAENAAKLFGFEVIMGGFSKEFFMTSAKDVIILAPNIHDEHPHHKEVNRLAKQLPNKKLYYSVDMNVKKEVLANYDTKRTALTSLYPSQKKLFEKDDKYHLFESILEDDSDKMIWVKFQEEGIHRYPAALTDPNLRDVSFLGNPHRHIFHFKIGIEVWHNDRDIEFIQFQRYCRNLFNGRLDLNYQSCEMLADGLYRSISARYPGRKMKIEVSEDGENGVEATYL